MYKLYDVLLMILKTASWCKEEYGDSIDVFVVISMLFYDKIIIHGYIKVKKNENSLFPS